MSSATSPESNRTYQLHRLIGKGGFGEVYLATPTPQGSLPPQVCLKISQHLSPWVREAYFAELLARTPCALKIYDRFAVADGSGARYCLAMEYAVHGDLGAWLEREGPQSEKFVRRELAGILSVLDVLHLGQGLHRDLTPFNVFVCGDRQLKLGDFGIATHQLSRRGVTADAFNIFNVPNEIAWGHVRRWQKRDDLYQTALIAVVRLGRKPLGYQPREVLCPPTVGATRQASSCPFRDCLHDSGQIVVVHEFLVLISLLRGMSKE